MLTNLKNKMIMFLYNSMMVVGLISFVFIMCAFVYSLALTSDRIINQISNSHNQNCEQTTGHT